MNRKKFTLFFIILALFSLSKSYIYQYFRHKKTTLTRNVSNNVKDKEITTLSKEVIERFNNLKNKQNNIIETNSLRHKLSQAIVKLSDEIARRKSLEDTVTHQNQVINKLIKESENQQKLIEKLKARNAVLESLVSTDDLVIQEIKSIKNILSNQHLTVLNSIDLLLNEKRNNISPNNNTHDIIDLNSTIDSYSQSNNFECNNYDDYGWGKSTSSESVNSNVSTENFVNPNAIVLKQTLKSYSKQEVSENYYNLSKQKSFISNFEITIRLFHHIGIKFLKYSKDFVIGMLSRASVFQ